LYAHQKKNKERYIEMIVSAAKYCDVCDKIVARKATLLYHTIAPYVTLRTDDPVTYVNMEDNTTRGKLHICRDCFKRMFMIYESQVKKCQKQK
jgi:hypothetical protein